MSKPIIGITQSHLPNRARTLRDSIIHDAYYFCISLAGGYPLFIEPNSFQTDALHLDGILFTGGGDINPHLYGEVTSEFAMGVDDSRDHLEMTLLHRAINHNIPFLGICRGLQLINVALGGSLYRDLKWQRPSSLTHDWAPSRKYLAHAVKLERNSRLHQYGFKTHFMVNSLHHQGIGDLGNGLTPGAYAQDGLVEAIELTGHDFGLAVQWHPEWLTDQYPTRCIFESFIRACEHTC